MTTLVSPIAIALTHTNVNLIPGGKGEVYAKFLYEAGYTDVVSLMTVRNLFVASSGVTLAQHAALLRMLRKGSISGLSLMDSLTAMISTGKSELQLLARESELTQWDHDLAAKVTEHFAHSRFSALTKVSVDSVEVGSYSQYVLTSYGESLLEKLKSGENVVILPPGITENSDSVQIALPVQFTSFIASGSVKVILSIPELRVFLDENPMFDYLSSDGLVVDTLQKIKTQ